MQSIERLNHLYNLLDKAAKLAAEFSGGYSINFLSAQEFCLSLEESIEKLKTGDSSQQQVLWRWFAPTCDWDDLIGKEGQDLGNKIFAILNGDVFYKES